MMFEEREAPGSNNTEWFLSHKSSLHSIDQSIMGVDSLVDFGSVLKRAPQFDSDIRTECPFSENSHFFMMAGVRTPRYTSMCAPRSVHMTEDLMC